MRNKTVYLLLILCVFSSAAWGQEEGPYRIGVDDRLQISFWQEAAAGLSSNVRVGEDGKITLPVIGEIQAAGLTTTELAKKIVQQMSFYNPGISQATVVVTEYNSQTVTLTGAVNNPGKYRFERIPNLLETIRQAGGATANADLSNVKITRQEGNKINVITVDLLKAIKSGDLSKVPVLKAKDLIHVPESPYGVAAEMLAGPAFRGKDIYFIYGAVRSPGVKSLAEDIDLLDAIVAAGGITELADPQNVKVIIKDANYSSVLAFDLAEFACRGRPARYKIRPEDTIVVPFKRTERSVWSRLPELIVPGLVTSAITAIIVRGL